MKRLIFCIVCIIAILALAACAPEEILPELETPVREPSRNMPMPVEIDEPDEIETDGDWPDRPIMVVVPFLGGGDTDMYARMMQPFLEEVLGQMVNVVNLDGNSGNLGAVYVYESAPDGYTVLFYHTGTMFTNYLAGNSHLNFASFEMSSVAIHCDANIMVIRPDLGIQDAREFLGYIRANPESLRLAVVSNTFSHSLSNIAESAGDFLLYDINVGSASVKAASVINGHADVAYNNLALFLPYIERGELIPLWIGSAQRNLRLPDVPTLGEVGIRNGFIGRSYFYAFPPGTDAAIIREFSYAVGLVTKDPEFREQLFETLNLEPQFIPYNQMHDYMFAEWTKYAELEDILID